MKQKIFIGSSSEAIDVCRAIEEELASGFDVTIWDKDVFRLTYSTLDSLLTSLDSSDAGIFVLTPDDLTSSRGVSNPAVRDNVLLELGMFIGRLGRDRTFMVAPDTRGFHLPSDLAGLTTALYDASRFQAGERRAAVGPACTKIRQTLLGNQPRITAESKSQARLDWAMRRMSKDIETLLDYRPASPDGGGTSGPAAGPALRFGRAVVHIETGRIENYHSDARGVIALPANEYFDDECVSDTRSALGAFVQHRLGGNVEDFVRRIRAGLRGTPSQRAVRAEHRVEESYGIGTAIFLDDPEPGDRLIVVSATTERAGIGLRAEPHFLYAALEGIVETMNAHRLSSLTMPVLGSGHGGMPLTIAILFNVLALRSIIAEDPGRHLREVRLVVFEGDSKDVPGPAIEQIVSRLAS